MILNEIWHLTLIDLPSRIVNDALSRVTWQKFNVFAIKFFRVKRMCKKQPEKEKRKTKAKAAFQPGQDTPWLIVDVWVCMCKCVLMCVCVCALVVAVCHNQTNAQQ